MVKEVAGKINLGHCPKELRPASAAVCKTMFETCEKHERQTKENANNAYKHIVHPNCHDNRDECNNYSHRSTNVETNRSGGFSNSILKIANLSHDNVSKE